MGKFIVNIKATVKGNIREFHIPAVSHTITISGRCTKEHLDIIEQYIMPLLDSEERYHQGRVECELSEEASTILDRLYKEVETHNALASVRELALVSNFRNKTIL